MALTLLFPLLASLQMLPRPVSPQDRDPAPQLTVSPDQPVYVTGEAVTLTCSAARTSTVSGIRFLRDDQEIKREELPSLPYNYTDSIQLSGVSGLRAGAYTCQSWKTVSGQAIPSERSRPISIAVTDRDPAPQLTVSPEPPVYVTGEAVTLTCSAAWTSPVSGVRFLRDYQEIHREELPSLPYSYTDSIQPSGVSGLRTTVYTCQSWKTVSGRAIPSERSRPISIAVTDPDPAPQLTVSPELPVYVTGEVVTLTCSAAWTSTVSGVRYLRDDQQIQREELPSLPYSYTDSIQPSGVSGLRAGAYTCQSWKTVSGREIPSERSRPISIAVTDPDPAPQLTVSPEPPVYVTGEAVTLTCSAARTSIVSRIRFFRDDQEIQREKLPSPRYRYATSIQLSGVSRLRAGAYTCQSWKTVSGRAIPSERSRPISIAVTDRDPAPQLTVSPEQPVYVTGEAVTLTCSAARTSTVSRVRFFRDDQEILREELPSLPYSYTDSIQLSGVSGLRAGVYTCQSWKTVSRRAIPSKRSRPISIAVTDRDPAPQLTVSPEHPVYVTGEAVTLTCSAARTSTVSGIRFLRDDQEIKREELPSLPYNYTDSIQLFGVSGLRAGEYTCQSWKTVSGRAIPSERSRPISIAVTDPLPAPQLTVSPQQPVYITGEDVTLTCSATGAPIVSGIRFFRGKQKIQSRDLPSPQYRHTGSIQLSGVFRAQAGAYTCESWKTESGREISSKGSQPISVAVTDPDPAPQLTVSPEHPVYVTGEAVTLTCSAASTSIVSGVRFLRDDQEIQREELPSLPYSYTDSIQLSGVSGLRAGAYTCQSWKTVSRRAIPSERSRPISIAVTDRDPAPQLTVSPEQPVYVTGEAVTLTCSAARTSTVSRVRFFRDDQEILREELPSLPYSYTDSIQLSGVSGLRAGVYTCQSWKTVSRRAIPSKRSRPISIAVTDLPPQPLLSMDPASGLVSEGFPLLITCTAPKDAGQLRFHFYKDSVRFIPGNTGSDISTTESSTSSVNISVLSILQAGPNNTGEFTCGYEKNVSGRWITSPRSWAVNVTVTALTASHYTRDILLGTGGVLLLGGALTALLCYCHRKKRVPKPLRSTKGSEPREHTRNLGPGCDNKGSEATGARAEQMEQGSEVTYALVEFPASQAHRTQKTKKPKPAEADHVLYSEVVTTHTWKATK
ncbi:Fc receptor-like protein 5 isoform 2-T2 [Pangshura tecta]